MREIIELALAHHRESCPMQDKFTELDDQVDDVRRWQASMYANGSGGPPGYIETFKDQVTKQIAELARKIETAYDSQVERKGEMRQETKDKHREVDRRNLWLTVISVLFAGILAFMAIISYKLH